MHLFKGCEGQWRSWEREGAGVCAANPLYFMFKQISNEKVIVLLYLVTPPQSKYMTMPLTRGRESPASNTTLWSYFWEMPVPVWQFSFCSELDEFPLSVLLHTSHLLCSPDPANVQFWEFYSIEHFTCILIGLKWAHFSMKAFTLGLNVPNSATQLPLQ